MDSTTLDLACELIKRPSVTPNDAGCLTLIGERLAAIGFELEFLPFGEVTNLWARHGDATPVFIFAGHTDVVPPGDTAAWQTPPFEPTCKNGLLYGRGAADMKGGVAAMVTATERFVAAHPKHRGTLSFLLTSDEEGIAADGTVKVIEHLQASGQALTWCLLGEPSAQSELGDIIRNGRRGSLNGRLHVHGVQGHVAYPEKAKNPILTALPALAELQTIEWDQGNAFYPATSFQISNINAGTGAENVIPAELELWFNFRYCTENTAETLKARLTKVLDQHGLDYNIDWHLSGLPFLTPSGELLDAVESAIEEELGLCPQLSTGGGTSDGRFIAPAGVEVIEFGPINATIHKINECVSIDDLDRLSATYESILHKLLA